MNKILWGIIAMILIANVAICLYVAPDIQKEAQQISDSYLYDYARPAVESDAEFYTQFSMIAFLLSITALLASFDFSWTETSRMIGILCVNTMVWGSGYIIYHNPDTEKYFALGAVMLLLITMSFIFHWTADYPMPEKTVAN